MAATSLPWTPPGYPSYTGYTNLSIGNANKSTLASLSRTTDYKITFTEAITSAVHGTPALQIIGGRNVVIIGGRIHHSATQGTTTCAAMTNVQTTIVLGSNTLTNGTAVSNGMYVVVDPGSGTASEAMTIGTFVSGTTWNVTRNTGYSGNVGTAVAHTGTPTVKQVSTSVNWGLYCANWTADLFLEGVLIDGTSLTQAIYQQNPSTNGMAANNARIFVQNCRLDAHADDVRNGNDAHADGWQIANGVAEMRLAYVSVRSTSNALQWQPYEWDRNWGGTGYVASDAVDNRLWDLRNVDLQPTTFHQASTGYADMRSAIYSNIYGTGEGTSTTRKTSTGYWTRRAPELNFENVYGRTVASPGDTNLTRWAGVDNHEILQSRITETAPPGGDFCAVGTPGTAYTAPGYDKAVYPTVLFGKERGYAAANEIRGLTKRTLSATGQQVSQLRAFVQMANYRRAVMEAGVGWYARLREASGTTVTEEPMWALGNGTTNAGVNGTTSPIADGGAAYTFNGTTQFASRAFDFSNPSGLNVDQLTLMAFVYVTNPILGSDQVIVEHTANFGSSDGGLFWENSPAGNGEQILGLRTAAAGFQTANFPVSTSAGWHHIFAEFDRTSALSSAAGLGALRFYLDGVAVTPSATSGAGTVGGYFANSTMYLMSRAGTSLFTAGRMAEFAWIPRLLPADEIAHIYNQSQKLSTGTAPLRMAVYKDPIASASSLVGLSDEVVVPAGQRGRLVSFPFTTPPAITTGSFWTGVFGGTNADRAALARRAGTSTDGGIKAGLTYPTAPTSITPDSYDQFEYMEELDYATAAADTTPPAAPTNLVATPGNTQVVLDWDDNTETDLAGTPYRVERKTGVGGTYAEVAQRPSSDYTNTGLVNGTTYFYRVRAVDAAGNFSGYSNEAGAAPTAPDTTPPAAPTVVGITGGAGQITIDWANNVETDLSTTAPYIVERALSSGGTYTQIATTTVSIYSDTTVTPGTTYFYRLKAQDASGNVSVASSIVSAAATPSTAAATLEAWVLDGIPLTSGNFVMMGLTANPPKGKPEWITGADSEWAALMGEPLHENREFVMKLRVPATASMDAALDQIAAIRDKLRKASRTLDGIPLVWIPHNSTRSRTFDVLYGEIPEIPIDTNGEGQQWFKAHPIFTVQLIAKPYWYDSIEVIQAAVAASTPLVTVDVTGVGGDVPALGRLIVTDAASQPRRDVEWGLQNRDLTGAGSYIIDSDNMITSGFSGAQATRTGAYDPNATGNNVIRASTVLTSPIAVCGTGILAHIGTFRVWARCYVANTTQRVRLSWRAGDGRYFSNNWVTPPASPGFVEMDLGTITIPQATLGTQVWDGRIEAYESDTTLASSALDVDYLRMTPAGEGYGRARSIYSYSPGVAVAYDMMLGANSGNLGGRTATLGGTWATTLVGSGTTDYTGTTNSYTTSQAGPDNTRYSILGTTSYGDTDVAAKIGQAGNYVVQTAPSFINHGVIARWIDSSNHAKLYYFRSPGYGSQGPSANLYLTVKTTAGGEVVIASAPLTTDYILPLKLHLVIFTSGLAVGLLYSWSTGALVKQISGFHSALVTGGGLGAGRSGIFDSTYQYTTGTIIRGFGEFSASTPPSYAPVINSIRLIQFRYDDTLRTDSGGTVYGKPQSYRGSRFLLPVGTSRIAVAARRVDLNANLADNVTDSTQLQVAYRERGLVVPRD